MGLDSCFSSTLLRPLRRRQIRLCSLSRLNSVLSVPSVSPASCLLLASSNSVLCFSNFSVHILFFSSMKTPCSILYSQQSFLSALLTRWLHVLQRHNPVALMRFAWRPAASQPLVTHHCASHESYEGSLEPMGAYRRHKMPLER